MSPASSDISASLTRNGFCGVMKNSRIVGLVTRKMNHENSRGPCRIAAVEARAARRPPRRGRSSAVSTTSAPSKALCIARYTPDENTGSTKA